MHTLLILSSNGGFIFSGIISDFVNIWASISLADAFDCYNWFYHLWISCDKASLILHLKISKTLHRCNGHGCFLCTEFFWQELMIFFNVWSTPGTLETLAIKRIMSSYFCHLFVEKKSYTLIWYHARNQFICWQSISDSSHESPDDDKSLKLFTFIISKVSKSNITWTNQLCFNAL